MDEKKQLMEEIIRRLPGATLAQLRVIRRMLLHRHTEETDQA